MFVTVAEDVLIYVTVFQKLFDLIDDSESMELDTVSSKEL